MDDHDGDYSNNLDMLQPMFFANCPREGLVADVLKLVREKGVVVIRATPQVGKSTLLMLLGQHIRIKETDLEPVYFTWKEQADRDIRQLDQYLREQREEWTDRNAEVRARNPSAKTIYLIDEAQNSYPEQPLWDMLIKNHSLRRSPLFVLACVYGAEDLPWLQADSQSLKIHRSQRIELRPSAGSLHMTFTQAETVQVVNRFALETRCMTGLILKHVQDLFEINQNEYDNMSLQQICMRAVSLFSPSVLRPRSSPDSRRTRVPEAAFQDEMYCCLNQVLKNLPILSEYSENSRGRIDFYIYSKKWGIEILQEGGKAEISEHAGRFCGNGKYAQWRIFKDFIILNFCQPSTIRALDIEGMSISKAARTDDHH
ncbi:MAG: hypothetical protein Q9227_005963 [Pyrenula ochraceoflavens]